MRRASLDAPPIFRLANRAPGRLDLESDTAARAHVLVLEDDIVRLLVLPEGGITGPPTWSIAPGAADVSAEGRDRFDVSGFALPEAKVSEADGTLVVETARIRLSIHLAGLRCRWQVFDGEWKEAFRDRPTQAYDFGWWDGKVRHYLARGTDEEVFGLGEVSGDQDRSGRRIRLAPIDAFGYSARTSGPLYKHIPFSITRRPRTGVSFGLYYDTYADCAFDLGCERDNYHGLYRSFEAEAGDLDLYVIAGADPGAIARRFTWLTGRPTLMPAWSLGYSGSTMALADAADAPDQLLAWLDQCRARDIRCPSFHLSSGYSKTGGRRYVFHWNLERFPDPARFLAAFADRRVRLAANIKPALLATHPDFEEAAARGLFIRQAAGAPALAQFWDGLGAWLDFTNPDTQAWWKAKVTTSLLDVGVAATWNDNNEFEVWSPSAVTRAGPASATRAVQPLLMMRASREAQVEQEPQKRPFVVSRSGCAGMQRYAQTWSGDNATSWETLRYNLKMGLGLALSGVSNSGHDVGGFAGPPPDPELLTRWVEMGIFMPRFSIHSWNDDGSVNSPWMHEGVADATADLIRFRGRCQPYLHYLSWRYARNFEPIWRPVFYDFPDDPASYEERDDFMLGPSLLVAPVVDPGVDERLVRLPAGAAWIDPWTGARHEGGTTITLPAPLGRPVFLVREGAILPVNFAPARFGDETLDLGFDLYPQIEGMSAIELFADDGESVVDVAGSEPAIRIEIVSDPDSIRVRAEGLSEPRFKLPPDETRPLSIETDRA
ncbi:MAG TPA: glycoside hydrolase family 31 protein [Caulobacteraceae bacterium]